MIECLTFRPDTYEIKLSRCIPGRQGDGVGIGNSNLLKLNSLNWIFPLCWINSYFPAQVSVGRCRNVPRVAGVPWRKGLKERRRERCTIGVPCRFVTAC